MMKNYGIAAVKAVKYYEQFGNPRDAWIEAASIVFDKKSLIDKGCPRSTFLSLCEKGVVKGIPKGNYATRVKENKVYAFKALEILKQRNLIPEIISSKDLWNIVQDNGKSSNSQMDVLLALWNNKLIEGL